MARLSADPWPLAPPGVQPLPSPRAGFSCEGHEGHGAWRQQTRGREVEGPVQRLPGLGRVRVPSLSCVREPSRDRAAVLEGGRARPSPWASPGRSPSSAETSRGSCSPRARTRVRGPQNALPSAHACPRPPHGSHAHPDTPLQADFQWPREVLLDGALSLTELISNCRSLRWPCGGRAVAVSVLNWQLVSSLVLGSGG